MQDNSQKYVNHGYNDAGHGNQYQYQYGNSPGQGQQPVVMQPTGGSTTVVQINQMQSAEPVEYLRDWNSGLCGCFEDCKSCLCVMFCTPCYLCCDVSYRMGEHCCTPIGYGCVDPSYTTFVLTAYRVKLRSKHNIRGSLLDDCCCSACCGPFVLCQLVREIDHIEQMSGKAAFNRV